MGELPTAPFQFTFNGFLKVAFQGSRITSDAGLILVRELDERLGLAGLIAAHLRRWPWRPENSLLSGTTSSEEPPLSNFNSQWDILNKREDVNK